MGRSDGWFAEKLIPLMTWLSLLPWLDGECGLSAMTGRDVVSARDLIENLLYEPGASWLEIGGMMRDAGVSVHLYDLGMSGTRV